MRQLNGVIVASGGEPASLFPLLYEHWCLDQSRPISFHAASGESPRVDLRRTVIYNSQDRRSAYIRGYRAPHLEVHRVHGIVCNKLWFSRVDHFASRAYKLAVMERIEPRPVMRCWKCKGPLSSETAINMQTGVSVQQFVCLN